MAPLCHPSDEQCSKFVFSWSQFVILENPFQKVVPAAQLVLPPSGRDCITLQIMA